MDNSAKTAVILAAGVGTRLRPLTNGTAKSTIEVAGRSLIKRLVIQLVQQNAEIQIYVAIGHHGETIRDQLVEFENNVIYVENHEYMTTNNMESCRLALDARSQRGPSLIINADCIYDDQIISKMFSAERSCIAADATLYLEESMKLVVENNLALEISKNIARGPNVYTSIDIYSFQSEDLARLHEIMHSFVASGDRNQWTEVAISHLIKERDVEVCEIGGAQWVEIDNHADLELARKTFTA